MKTNHFNLRSAAAALLLLATTFFAAGVRADITTDLWGYWPLDGTLVDASGNGRNLSSPGVGGSPVINVNGRVGESYQFNNTGSAQMLWPGVLDAIPIAGSADLTFTAWINPSVLEAGFTSFAPHTIMRLYNSVSGADLTLRILDSKLDAYYSTPAGNLNNSSAFDIPLNTWSFVAVTVSGTSLKLYVNEGAPQSFTVNNDRGVSNRLVFGAASNTASPRGLTGQLDEVRLYTRALSDADILEVYNYTPGGGGPGSDPDPSAGLVGHWKFDGDWTDETENELDLVSVGTGAPPVSTSEGITGTSYEFKNISEGAVSGPQVLGPTLFDLTPTSGVTITAWIKPSQLQAGFTSTSPHMVALLYGSSTNTLQLRIRDSKLEAFYTNPSSNNLSSLVIPTDTWSFVAVTQNGTDLRLYHNDQSVSFVVNGNNLFYTSMNIGAATRDGIPRGIEGLIDEVRLYDRALTPQEVEMVRNFQDVIPTAAGNWAIYE